MNKRSILFVCIVLVGFTQVGRGQLLFEDNFEYLVGTLTAQTSNWTESPTGSTDIQVTSSNLTYASYISSGIGNSISLDGGAASRSGVIRTFSSQNTVGITVFCPFLLQITSTLDMDLNSSTGDYFANFENSTASTQKAYLYVKTGSSSSKFNIGLAKSSSSSLTWSGTELDVNTIYLIVVGYSFVTGADNDISKLWINPPLDGSEPSADIAISSGADASDISIIQFRQRAKSGDMQIDGIRVATSWADAPLPVELTSFTSSVNGNAVTLAWKTATEVDNYGFEIERIRNEDPQKAEGIRNWSKVGFVNGAGNSNSPKEYSFTDKSAASGKYLYRLKQLDNDGQYTYSKEVEVEVDLGTPTAFTLEQNYPNPFNPTTSLQYTVSSLPNGTVGKQFITIKVFDMLGREIALLVNGEKEPGTYTTEFATTGLASGTYIYRMQAGEFVQTRKMVILK